MAEAAFTPFEQLLVESRNELGTSVLLVLAWIAVSDGFVDASERKQIEEIARVARNPTDVGRLLRIAQQQNIHEIQLALEIIRQHFTGERAELFVSMALGIVLADGQLAIAEHHILMLLADLVGLEEPALGRLFRETTGRPLPRAPDISTADFWLGNAHAGGEQEDRKQRKERSQSRQQRPNSRAAALRILGLEAGATAADIKAAYRRLAQANHPDRFASLGEESVAAATQTFQRIQQAYEELSANA